MDLRLLIDLLFALGIVGFLSAAVKQLYKILKTKQTMGISLKHCYFKAFAIICMMIGYVLSELPISFIISLAEFTIIIISINRIAIYRWGKFNWRKIL